MKTSSKPKISVVMAVFNGIPYLQEAIKSVLGQTLKDFEFIIVDDASTDETWLFLKSLKDKRIKLVKNKKNIGLANSLNIGINASKANYIARMDADDISLPNRFYNQYKFMEANKHIGICGSWVELINEQGRTVGIKKLPTSSTDINKFVKYYCPLVHPTFFIRASLLKIIGKYNPHFEYAEDYELILRATQKFELANIPKILLKWRLWNQRRSQRAMKKVDVADLKVKMEAFKNGNFGPFYSIIIAKKLITTYLLPHTIKMMISRFLLMS